jgi:hypothetical protein
MKFACRGETIAPPMRWPFRPHSSISRPRRVSGDGFLKTLPNVRLFVGCVDFRCASSSATCVLDLVGGPRREPEAHLGDDLPRAEARVPVRELEIVGRDRMRTRSVDDRRALEDRAPVAAVGARVHAQAAAGGAGDRRRELEAAEAGRACAVQGDGVRRASARDERLALDARLRELARELEHERVHAVVVHEQVRPEPDDVHGRPAPVCPRQRLLQLVDGLRPREPPRRPARAERREARERDVLLDGDHRSSSAATMAGARSTSPAPIVSSTSPGLRAPREECGRLLHGRHPRREPARVRDRVDDELARHAVDRLLARGVHVGDHDVVRGRERGPELAREVPRARVEVRLEQHAHTAARIPLAYRVDRRGDLGGWCRSRRRGSRRRARAPRTAGRCR